VVARTFPEEPKFVTRDPDLVRDIGGPRVAARLGL
jgi:hypothetical protein